ncbi:MAG TPA: type IV pili twitching motility protein PilT, partial [Candidatus Magasanikbacteria bacterium]|nr:type IV pili twitching motility protein PilT [Candidatus Magasanikbacteria bacterium]
QLASVLRGVIAQQLYPRLDGGRVAARELLIINSAARNLIRENNVAQLKSVIQTGSKEGMMTMEQSVKELVKNKIIDKRFLPE